MRTFDIINKAEFLINDSKIIDFMIYIQKTETIPETEISHSLWVKRFSMIF